MRQFLWVRFVVDSNDDQGYSRYIPSLYKIHRKGYTLYILLQFTRYIPKGSVGIYYTRCIPGTYLVYTRYI
jgi:hypothetical protein